MTKAQTIAAIKALPGRCMTARCTDGEWRVSFSIPAIQMANDLSYVMAKARNEAVAYYTNDAEDAVASAKAMNDQFVQTGRI
jgi:hypothetical protein